MPPDPSRICPAVFLDRDGTLMEEVDYCADPAKVRVFPNVPDALAKLQRGGFALVMITNQSGIGRGYFTERDFDRVQAECLRQLAPVALDACYHCPDSPERASERRKPGPGMLLEAARDHRLDLARSYMIGDSQTDVQCGHRAGVAASLLVLTGKVRTEMNLCQADAVVADLSAATDWILAKQRTQHG